MNVSDEIINEFESEIAFWKVEAKVAAVLAAMLLFLAFLTYFSLT